MRTDIPAPPTGLRPFSVTVVRPGRPNPTKRTYEVLARTGDDAERFALASWRREFNAPTSVQLFAEVN